MLLLSVSEFVLELEFELELELELELEFESEWELELMLMESGTGSGSLGSVSVWELLLLVDSVLAIVFEHMHRITKTEAKY